MPSPANRPSSTNDASLGRRLDSWKEIAVYLGKVERTVKRWESARGLPIHRVPGGGRASVYAFTRELDEWLKSTKTQETDAVVEDTPEKASSAGDTTPLEVESGEIYFQEQEDGASKLVLHRSSLLAFLGLLVLCLAGSAIYSVRSRGAGIHFSNLIRDVYPDSRAGENSVTSATVSDAERIQARALYLKGRYEWNQRTPESLNRALDYFTQAIVHDPGFAQAYVGMADTYDLLREYSTMPDSEAYARAIAAATKAVEIDDSLAEAHRALAFSKFWGEWDFEGGEKEFLRAIQLNPNDPIARKWYANALSLEGRFPEALNENGKAQVLDPTSHSILADRGWMLFNSGRQEDGIALIKEVERSAPDFLSPHNYLMAIGFVLRDYPTYLSEGEKAAEGENDAVLKGIIASARTGYERDGERGLLKNLYTTQRAYYQAGKLSATMLAKTCVLLGKKQEAIQLLEEAYAHHETSVLACNSEADLNPLRDEPRFMDLVRKINLSMGPQNALPAMNQGENRSSFRASIAPH